MLWAIYPFGLIADINRNTVQVWCAPCRFSTVLCIVSRAFFSADRATALNPFVGSGMDANLFLLICLPIAVDGFFSFFPTGDMHTTMLEIEDIF